MQAILLHGNSPIQLMAESDTYGAPTCNLWRPHSSVYVAPGRTP